MTLEPPHPTETASAATEAAIKRFHEDRQAAPLPAAVIRRLEEMPRPLSTEMRAALQSGAREPGFASPRHWSESSIVMNMGAVLDACRACADYSVEVVSIASLVTPEALNSIARRVIDGQWSGVNLLRVLNGLRKVHRVVHGSAPKRLTARISHYSDAARRDQWDSVLPIKDYIVGAVAVAALADIMTAVGMQRRGQSLLRDAALLAIGAEVNFRTQEYHRADIELITLSKDGPPSADLYVRAKDCKIRQTRIGTVYDPRALNLLQRIIGLRTKGPLFCTNAGQRLGKPAIYASLTRTSMLALGVPVTANLLRRSGASSVSSPAEKASRLGQSASGSRTPLGVKTYSRSTAAIGLQLLRNAMT